MLKNLVLPLLFSMAASSGYASTSKCIVLRANPGDPNKYDQLVTEGDYDIDSSVAILQGEGGVITVHRSAEGSVQISSSTLPKKADQPTLNALAVGATLPLVLIDGVNKIMVTCR